MCTPENGGYSGRTRKAQIQTCGTARTQALTTCCLAKASALTPHEKILLAHRSISSSPRNGRWDTLGTPQSEPEPKVDMKRTQAEVSGGRPGLLALTLKNLQIFYIL